MLSDIEIAENCALRDIADVAAELGIAPQNLESYGRFKAKIGGDFSARKAKLVLVTAINPTASGEGKTTVSIGLADGMRKLGKKVCLALREPSLGPVFGIKGGAAGGGYAQIVPMEDINLHFTGDLHAITAANNLLCAVLDNHIFRGNELDIDPEKIYFRRCLDMNDRALRNVTVGRGGEGVEREEHFEITAACEVMAILCLATSLSDLKRRLGNIIVGENRRGEYVYARDLKAEGAMCTLLKDAIKPNLVQTLEGTPAIVHGGPFANIAHGCNSIQATYAAMSLADYVVTEAGFGADLGAEKFLDTKCRIAGIEPDCVVVVATVKALKLHGGADKTTLSEENLEALEAGMPNLVKHIENIKNVYKKPVVVAMNRFASDTQAEIDLVMRMTEYAGAQAVFTDVFLQGGEGGKELAAAVVKAANQPSRLAYSYDLRDGVVKKIDDIVKNVYGGDGAEFSELALRKIEDIEKRGYKELPVIIAKTQYSLSDNAKLLARPQGFTVHVRDVILKGGAEFIVAVAGNIMLMPGLGKHPAAERIDIDEAGKISGLS
ncbi:formate--tetrahydrofolate ligase [Candidatus Borkfalkia ceftriaxoniphila]|uniref:Formate--tetrahydrofolate ligase n=1 Tax=Candidatus Borkfalkia ceftriaxoniphila TaxID=2508949 RepID=A0A4Q2KCZ3_9FIRM|nr:formate--tetrahydrofolate ligase [Candidatus Borkfalkia ceftriaxoniphila]RXZ61161.1 formate--tetrahydrofolate ligase [Candidatus Borkfalkia ceftriaxoniphila]